MLGKVRFIGLEHGTQIRCHAGNVIRRYLLKPQLRDHTGDSASKSRPVGKARVPAKVTRLRQLMDGSIRYGFHAHSAEWDRMARRQRRSRERYGKPRQRHAVVAESRAFGLNDDPRKFIRRIGGRSHDQNLFRRRASFKPGSAARAAAMISGGDDDDSSAHVSWYDPGTETTTVGIAFTAQ
jgi:hypothetical protein